MPNIKKVAILSLAVLIVQTILNVLIYPLFKVTTQTIFAISPVSGVGGKQVGDTILGYMTGLIPIDFTSFKVWIVMYLGVFALVWLGFWIYELGNKRRFIWQGNNLTQRLIAILLYGHIVLFAVLWLMKMNVPSIALNLLIGLLINLAATSFLISLSVKYLHQPKV